LVAPLLSSVLSFPLSLEVSFLSSVLPLEVSTLPLALVSDELTLDVLALLSPLTSVSTF